MCLLRMRPPARGSIYENGVGPENSQIQTIFVKITLQIKKQEASEFQ